MGAKSFSPGVNLPVREDDHSSPSSAGGKNEWSCTATPTTCLQRVHSDKLYTFIFNENPTQHVLHSIFTCQHACRIRGQYLIYTDCIFGTMYCLYILLGRRNLWCAVRKNSGKQWAKTGRVSFNPQEDHTVIRNDSPKGRTCVCVYVCMYVCVCVCVCVCVYIYIYISKCFTIANRCTYLLVLESTKIYIKIYTEVLLHVSVCDHHQGAYTWA